MMSELFNLPGEGTHMTLSISHNSIAYLKQPRELCPANRLSLARQLPKIIHSEVIYPVRRTRTQMNYFIN